MNVLSVRIPKIGRWRCRAFSALAALGLAGGLPVLAQSSQNPSTPSAADIAAAQQQGASIAQGYRSGLPQVDANGQVVTTATGQIATGPQSSSSVNGASVLMQNLTGVTGYQTTGNPGGSRQVFAGASTSQASVDIPCAAPSGSVRSAGGVAVQFLGCLLANSQIVSVTAQFCPGLNAGSSCAASDYSAPVTLANGQYTTVGSQTVGVGCSDTVRACRLTVVSRTSLNVTAAQLSTQASAANTGSGVRSALTGLVQSQAYSDQLTQQQGVAKCYSQNQASFGATGAVSTCSGNASTVVTGGEGANSCTQTSTCVKPTTSTSTYTTTCTRSFPVTTYTCASTTPTRDCTVTVSADNGAEAGNGSTCTAADLAGGVLVGTTRGGCVQFGTNANGKDTCLAFERTEHYAFPGRATAGANCSASPLPIDGPFNNQVCAMSETNRTLSCAPGGWYARTLTDQECQTSTINSSGQSTFTQWDYRAKAGCGYCINNQIGYTCRGKPAAGSPGNSCAAASLGGCTLTGVKVQSAVYGLTLSQLETYSCSTTTTGCAQWQTTNNCTSVATPGSPTPPATTTTAGDNGSFNQMLAAGAMAEGVSASGRDQSAIGGGTISIFPGLDERCRKPLGFIDKVISNDCCTTGLTRPGGGRPLTSCTKAEVDLAAARRSNFEVYVGNYCSKKIDFLFFTTCIEQTQTYCVFKGVLPRIVQVQGRKQLQAIASGSLGASLQTTALNFPYYAGVGGWTTPETLNGVQVAAFQQPAYCASSDLAAAALKANPNTPACPATLGVWLAACEVPTGCGALPDDPLTGAGAWTISSVDPLTLVSVALSNHAIAKGACDTTTGRCAYTVSAWPASSGGRAMVSRDVTFGLYTTPEVTGTYEMASIGSTAFRAQPQANGASANLLAMPASLTAQYSTNGGNTWQAMALPTNITSNVTIPGTDVTVTGGCTAVANTCDYKLIGSVAITAKPWGSATRPDCSGFTLDQFTALDMGKMDLSEWVASVQSKVTQTSGSGLTSSAAAQASRGNAYSASNPNPPQSAEITPNQGLGPFTVQLAVTGNWPGINDNPALNTDPVFSADIDWGDCSGKDVALALPRGGFAATHLYKSPDSPGMCDAQGASGPGTARTLNHHVVVTLHSRSGVHPVSLGVQNAYLNYAPKPNVGNGTGETAITGGP